MGIRSCTALRRKVHLCCWMVRPVLSCLWTSVFWGGQTCHKDCCYGCVLVWQTIPDTMFFRTHFRCSLVPLRAFMALHSFWWTCMLMSLKRFILCVHVFGLHICLCIMCMQCFSSPEEAIGSPELELHMVGKLQCWTKNQTWVPARTASALKCWATTPVSTLVSFGSVLIGGTVWLLGMVDF